jgi:hypothetical protein
MAIAVNTTGVMNIYGSAPRKKSLKKPLTASEFIKTSNFKTGGHALTAGRYEKTCSTNL